MPQIICHPPTAEARRYVAEGGGPQSSADQPSSLSWHGATFELDLGPAELGTFPHSTGLSLSD